VLASGPRTIASGPLLSKFITVAQNFSYATEYTYVKQKLCKGWYFDHFEYTRRLFHFSWKKW